MRIATPARAFAVLAAAGVAVATDGPSLVRLLDQLSATIERREAAT